MSKKRLPKNVRERDGKYYYRYSIKNPVTGKRKQKESIGFASAKEAEKEGIRIQVSLMKGVYIEKVKLTVGSWCDDWLKWYSSTGVKKSTIRSRENTIEMIKKQVGGLNLNEMTDDVYQNVLHTLHEQAFSHNTITLFHGVANMIFDRAVQKGKLKSSPTDYAYIPKKVLTFEERESAKILPRFLEKDELKRFLGAVENEQFIRVFRLLAYTGMRMGELAALLISDFSKDGLLTISKTRFSPGKISEYELTSPKNKSSDRTIHLSKKAIAVIKDQLTWRKAFAFAKGDKFYKDYSFLFICERRNLGYPLTHNIVYDHMNSALEKAKLPMSLTPHSLRHTYTSLMAEAGADLDTIQAQLGHQKGSDTTRSIYLHITKAREKRNVDLLDALLDADE